MAGSIPVISDTDFTTSELSKVSTELTNLETMASEMGWSGTDISNYAASTDSDALSKARRALIRAWLWILAQLGF